MEYTDIAQGRRSIRGFKPDLVPKDVINEIVDVARFAPSSMNTQPWHVHVVTGEPLERIRAGNTERMMDGAKPTTLLRTFTEFFGSAESSDGDAEEGSWEEIEDATIKFAWDEDEGDYEITFEDGDGDEDALQALDPDMDYRVLLPEGAVSEGDEWEVAGTEIGSILFPGIDLRRAADADMELDGEEIPEELIEALENFLDSFEVTCTYKGGDEAAEIAVAATVTDAIDIDPSMLGEDMEEMGGEMELSVEISAEFEGALLWDLASGHFQSMEMTGEGTLGVQMLMSIPDFDMEFENEFLASFVMEQTASCEKAE